MLQHPPLIVVLLLVLLLLCKVSGTVTVGSKRRCFWTNKELRAAVRNYMKGGTTKKATTAKYGSSIGSWCVGKVKDFSYVFSGTYDKPSFFNEPLTNWDTSKATNMRRIFHYAESFDQPLDSWNVSRVTDMSLMFFNAYSFNQALSSWNVSRVTDMSLMFMGASSFNQALDQWNVSQVTSMTSMFYGAANFNQPLASWNVGRVTDMNSMFSGANSFNQPLDRWNVSQVTSTSGMFYYAENFNQPLNSWNVSQVLEMTGMFEGASAFDQNLCSWGLQISKNCNVDIMFWDTNCPLQGDPIFDNPYGPLCQACKNSQVISAESEKTGLFAPLDQVWVFELKEMVGAGHRLMCELGVPNGDANLFIKFGSFPESAQDCDVSSTNFGPFDEDCMTAPANTNTTAYISVQAARESSNMTLSCNIDDLDCLDLNQLCNKTEDCCGTRVCDGNETVAPRCVPCRKPEPCDITKNAKCPNKNKSCTKPSGQCCRRYACDGGTCRKKS